jgi:hypothetical protein
MGPSATYADARHDELMKYLAWFLLLLCSMTAVFADGGVVLLQRNAGPFTITLFSTSPRLRPGDADISVMVQDRKSGEVLLDPVINLQLTGDEPGSSPRVFRLSHDHATNRLLQATTVHFFKAGQANLAVIVQRGDEIETVGTDVSIEQNRSAVRRVWFYLLVPPAVIMLFLFHQRLKGGRQEQFEAAGRRRACS